MKNFDFVVITRSKNKKLQQQIPDNISCLHLPAIKIKTIDIDQNKINSLSEKIKQNYFDFVILSSVNSSRYLPQTIYKALRKKQTPIASVGKISAKKAQKKGLNISLISPNFKISGLLINQQLISKNNFLFIKGVGGNQVLIDYLKEQNKNIEILDVYQRILLTYSDQKMQKLINQKILWIFYSQSALTSVYQNFSKDKIKLNWLVNQSALCLSKAISDKAKQLKWQGQIHCLNSMDTQIIFNQIRQLVF